jgi:hypothetical protein
MVACDNNSSQRTLIDAKRVETDRIGDSAQTSRYYVALTNFMNSPTAISELSTVFKKSPGPAGKLYALYGLSLLDNAKFEALPKQVNPGEMVEVQQLLYSRYRPCQRSPARDLGR